MATATAQLDQHIAAARRRLAHIGGIARRTDDTERAIRAAAEERLATVTGDLARLKPRALTDADAGEAYQRLVLERGQLLRVIAQADHHGAGDAP